MITKAKKQNMLERYVAELQKAKAFYLFSAKGVAANHITELKKEMKQNNASFGMVKNNIFKLAAEEVLGEGKFPQLTGQYGVVVAFEDAVTPAKIVKDFKAKYKEVYKESLMPEVGMLEKEVIAGTDVDRLANLPTREQLLGQLLSVMVGPVRGFLTVTSGVTRGFVQVVKAYSETKEQA